MSELHDLTELVETLINGKWRLNLLPHRAERPEWPWWEAHTLALANHLIKPESVVWDIGGEEGDFPALWGSWGANVVIVEPNPYVWTQIRLHWEANCVDDEFDEGPWFLPVVGLASDVTVEAEPDYPIGSRGGWPEVAYGEVFPAHGFRHIWEHSGVSPQFRLDDLGLPDPDVVMMDIEGGEFHALRGMERTLIEARPHLVVSVHSEFMMELYGERSEDLVAWVASMGYDWRLICTDHEQHVWFSPK